MKKIKSRLKTIDESKKKTLLKFRGYYDDDIGDEEFDEYTKRKKKEGKRKHRKKPMNDEFIDHNI